MVKTNAICLFGLFLVLCCGILSAEHADLSGSINCSVMEVGEISVTFIIPEGMHQTLQEDYFYIETDPIDGVEFEKTVYPEGTKDEYGYINYHGSVTLTRRFLAPQGFTSAHDSITVYAGYQLCYPSYCLPPEEVELHLPVSSIIQSTIQTKGEGND